VRNIQVHGKETDRAQAGMRTAINLQGFSREDVERGQWIVPVGVFKPTRLVDARLDLLDRPARGEVKVHFGTAELTGELSMHEVDGLDVARIRLKEPVIAAYDDRFIIRSISPAKTIAGGTVINPLPHRRFSPDIARDLLSAEKSRRVAGIVRDAGLRGVSRKGLAAVFAEEPASLDKVLSELLSTGRIIRFDPNNDLYVFETNARSLREMMLAKVREHHEQHASSSGISREHLRSSLKGSVDPKLFHKLLTDLVKKGELQEAGPDIRAKGFTPSLGDAMEAVGERVYAMLLKSGVEPPRVQDMAERLSIDLKQMEEVLGFLARQGRLIRIKDGMYITDVADAGIKEKVRGFITEHGSIEPSDMKQIVGVSRKYAIPFLEYLDRTRYTVRVGNVRKLAQGR
jgi:selenocysteine-specific elongation factor